ncbi:metal-dependent hydrolase [Sessilibacter sp. MAH1]
MFENSWQRCWQAIGAIGSGSELRQKLIDAYNEPQRQYHTGQHLAECLSLFDEYIDCAIEPGEVEMALWFHDAVYDVKASDNEEQSAIWAVNELKQYGVASEKVSRINALILATKHTALPEGDDQKLLIDIDLAILGASESRFDEYEQQVRKEYSFVPGFIFRKKRKQILKQFLARDSIYSTPVLRARFEDQARDNIKRSMSK